ncbi:hypothetical protein O3G_MSEX008859 [Manduca sexta]|uniref:Uncharacterized protein n=1 Tax=Manduca sexta TaxID=7130 RepID=A0A921ZC13_MANSE|nr:hypothetical protein O3G_MSEX008859 [Manduca sexta]KAG6454800.1 hypothetical protein O3G_MSEX008859 [Manduca sexta]
MPTIKPCLLFILLGVACATAQSYYGVSVHDNNVQGSVEINLSDAKRQTYNSRRQNPSGQGNNVPPQNVPQGSYDQQRNFNSGPSQQGPYDGDSNTQTIRLNGPGQGDVRLFQEIGEDGSTRQAINYGNSRRQDYPSYSQDNSGRNPQSQPITHKVTVEDFASTTKRYFTRSTDNSNYGWDAVPVTYNGRKKVCYCPKRS